MLPHITTFNPKSQGTALFKYVVFYVSHNVPDLVCQPSEANRTQIDQYNFWIDVLVKDNPEHLFHYII